MVSFLPDSRRLAARHLLGKQLPSFDERLSAQIGSFQEQWIEGVIDHGMFLWMPYDCRSWNEVFPLGQARRSRRR
jgi:hypothetical protein